MLYLECPNCKGCPTIEEWNNSPGIRDELIPEDMEDADAWEDYRREHSGRVDCPLCGDVAIYEDMMAV